MLPSISVSPPIRLSPCTIIGACPSFFEEKAFAPSFEIESKRGCIGLFLRLESPVIIAYPPLAAAIKVVMNLRVVPEF